MRTEYAYSMKQVPKLAMTKEMQLSIKILQMSSLELSEYVEKEFVDNPVIEINDNPEISIKDYDFNIPNRKCSSTDKTSPFNFVLKEKSLREYLHEQILEVEKDKIIRKTADYIVECLNECGYLEIKEEVICQKLKVNIEVVEKALKLIHSLEPVGIGARNLKECLIIQLNYLNINEPKLEEIVNNNLEDIGSDNYKKIAKELNITKAEAQKYSQIIRRLEPKPSRGFYTGDNYKYVVPDAQIKKTKQGIEIIMNDQSVPDLFISNTYKNILISKSDEGVEKYIKDKLKRAEYLIKSIQERKSTLKNILQYIVKKQYEYFMGREKYLKPMMIKEAAEELGYSESTVSRAVKDKFILTDSGMVKVKELFKLGTIKCNKTEVSVNYIKSVIKKIINEEDKNNPIADQTIADNLKAMAINISRRTVAKYREEMGIKSSHKRKFL